MLQQVKRLEYFIEINHSQLFKGGVLRIIF